MRLTAKLRRSLAVPATAGLTALLIAAVAAPASADTSNVRNTAFQANTGHLFIYYPSNNSHTDTGLGVAAGTSPSYAGSTSSGLAVAFHAATGHLRFYTATNAGHRDTGLGMAAGTSTSIEPATAGLHMAFPPDTAHRR